MNTWRRSALLEQQSVCRTLWNIYDEGFLKNRQCLLGNNYFLKEATSYMFDMVVNTALSNDYELCYNSFNADFKQVWQHSLTVCMSDRNNSRLHMFYKYMFLKLSPKFEEKKPVPELFFNKILGFHVITFITGTPSQVFF